jgi:hypothetical protein
MLPIKWNSALFISYKFTDLVFSLSVHRFVFQNQVVEHPTLNRNVPLFPTVSSRVPDGNVVIV